LTSKVMLGGYVTPSYLTVFAKYILAIISLPFL
jgi:hypothetical protein